MTSRSLSQSALLGPHVTHPYNSVSIPLALTVRTLRRNPTLGRS